MLVNFPCAIEKNVCSAIIDWGALKMSDQLVQFCLLLIFYILV